MAVNFSLMRRRIPAAVQAAACAGLIAVAAIGGCDRASGLKEDQAARPAPMTEDEFVEQLAALTLAVEEGLTGEEARARAAELGETPFTREEMEAFADILADDPERWADVATRVDRRIEELRADTDASP
jgi:U3 small nucleolar RNA-associated protein 14